jgi:hypothetical protein
MNAKHFWLASVLVTASAFSAASARASDETIAPVSVEGCANCGTGSTSHIGASLNVFHLGGGCATCGDHGSWFTWRPGQVICGLHAKMDAKVQSLIDCVHAPTCAGAKGQQPIQPQYMYNPYTRSPRDYFMNDR